MLFKLLWIVSDFSTGMILSNFINKQFPSFQHKNVDNCLRLSKLIKKDKEDHTELMFEVISRTVGAIEGSVFKRFSTLWIELRTVEWFLPY